MSVITIPPSKSIYTKPLVRSLSNFYVCIMVIIAILALCKFAFLRDMAIVLERYRLDRRRVEAAHFQFAVLQVASWYPHQLELTKLRLHGDIDATLSSVVASYHGLFMAQYSS